jgi:hypothetical protein
MNYPMSLRYRSLIAGFTLLFILGTFFIAKPYAVSGDSYSTPTYVICQTAGMYENATGSSRLIREYRWGESIGYRRYATEHPGWDVVENWSGSTSNNTRWGFMLHSCVAH